MNTGIDNKPFEVILNTDFFSYGDFLTKVDNSFLKIESKPKKLWYYDILYYLSLGFIDKRCWKYKVKII